jgi:hypothetical protein
MTTWSGPHNAAGVPHGWGKWIYPDGGTAEGECVDGLMQGTWLRTQPDGIRLERRYVDSNKIGEKVRFSAAELDV